MFQTTLSEASIVRIHFQTFAWKFIGEQSTMKRKELPDSELDVMLALWELDCPSTIADIHRLVQSRRKCSKAAVHILVDRLCEKGYVKIENIDAPVPYKLVSPLVTRDEYCGSASDGFISKLFSGRWQNLIANLVDTGKISDDDIAELEEIIRRGKD